MKLSEFNSGKYSSLGTYNYEYFLPNFINEKPLEIDSSNLIKQVEKSSLKLGELNSLGKIVPDVNLFISSFSLSESVYSSKIEGTQTNIEDAFKEEEEIAKEKKDDWLEVALYNKATNEGIKLLKKLPISSRFIRSLHKTLLSKGRGENKLPGEFRKSQNWIGGSSIQTAHFIPPHHDHLEKLMQDLEKFIHNDKFNIPHLIKIGIIHYQFETIHPFFRWEWKNRKNAYSPFPHK